MKNRVVSKEFLTTMFLRQNEHHRYSVLGHTLKVMWGCFKFKRLDLLPAALLHDIGKPFVAYKDEKDLEKLKQGIDSYSFTNHEEYSYQLIKKCFNKQKNKTYSKISLSY